MLVVAAVETVGAEKVAQGLEVAREVLELASVMEDVDEPSTPR